MLICLDTEFTGVNQTKPDLISIGLVDETGREFYAELPESHWTVQCTEWVHFNVLPHLWGGDSVQNLAVIRDRLVAWIEHIPEDVVIVTNFANSDFFSQLKPLLTQWPKNLSTWPIEFTTWSMGDDLQPALQKLMKSYHGPTRPEHHALHDAHALRQGLLYALENGWQPPELPSS